MLKKFRIDTDFAEISFYEFGSRLFTPISLIISKYDVFTKNYNKAEHIWRRYFVTVNDVYFIYVKL